MNALRNIFTVNTPDRIRQPKHLIIKIYRVKTENYIRISNSFLNDFNVVINMSSTLLISLNQLYASLIVLIKLFGIGIFCYWHVLTASIELYAQYPSSDLPLPYSLPSYITGFVSPLFASQPYPWGCLSKWP